MPTPPIVEISGSPQAGKDSVLQLISKPPFSIDQDFEIVESGARVSPITKDHHPELMIWTVGRVLSDISEALAAYLGGDTRVRIFNRGLFDRLSWLEASNELFGLRRTDVETMQDVLLSLLLPRCRFRALVILTPPELTLARSERIRLGISRHRVLNKNVLTVLNQCYLECAAKYSDHFDMLKIITEFEGPVSLEEKALNMRTLLTPFP
jgi:hypothetical protein